MIQHWLAQYTRPVLTFAAIGLALIFAGVIVDCAIQRHKYRNHR